MKQRNMGLKTVISVLFLLTAAASAQLFSRSALSGSAEASSSRRGVPIEMVISSDEFQRIRQTDQRFLLFDARNPSFYEESHIPGAILPLTPDYYKQEKLFKKGLVPNMPDYDAALAEKMRNYPKDILIIAYCETGCQASAGLVLALRRMGYRKAFDMEEKRLSGREFHPRLSPKLVLFPKHPRFLPLIISLFCCNIPVTSFG